MQLFGLAYAKREDGVWNAVGRLVTIVRIVLSMANAIRSGAVLMKLVDRGKTYATRTTKTKFHGYWSIPQHSGGDVATEDGCV